MGIGSIVVIKPHQEIILFSLIPHIKWYPVCDEKTPYIIRDIKKCPFNGLIGATFEEEIIGYNGYEKELGIDLKLLTELLPPEDISEKINNIIENFQLIK